MTDPELKDARQLKIVYDWLQITRKPQQDLRTDIIMVMDLVKVPISEDEVNFLIDIIDPKHQKIKLTEEDFLSCLMPTEEKKKSNEKNLDKAFKHLSSNSEFISFEILKQCLEKQKLDGFTVQLVLKQMAQWETTDKQFDYKGFITNDF